MVLSEKKNRRIINITLIVLLLNFVLESYLDYFSDRSLLITSQVLLHIGFILSFFIFWKGFAYSRIFKLVGFIIFYFSFLSLFSSDLVKTINFLLKFILPLFYLLIGYNILISESSILWIFRKSWIFLAYFVFHVLLSNILGFGNSLYSQGIKIGYFTLNPLYIPTFCVLIVLFFKSHFVKKEKFLNILFAFLASIIIVLILKRTLILILGVGFITFFFLNFSLRKVFSTSIVVIALSIALFYFSSYFENSLSARESRFSSEYSIESEGRFTENIYIYKLMKDSPLILVCGSGEVFNDIEALATLQVYDEKREAHNSYIRLFWSGGIIGLFIFLRFYYKQLSYIRSAYIKNKFEANVLKRILEFGMLFVVLRFINDFSSGITYLGYNAYSYFLIGGIIRVGLVQSKMFNNDSKNRIYQ